MFAVSQFTTMPQDAQTDLATYVEAGVEGIEVCESKFPEAKTQRDELASLLRSGPLAPVSVQTKVHSIFPDRMADEPRSPHERLEDFKRSIAYWSEALALPGLPFVLISGVAPGQNLRDGWRAAIDFVREAAAFAESCDATIAFEPLGPCMMHYDTFIYGLEQGEQLINAADSSAVGLVIDAFHVWEEKDLANRLTRLAPRVSVVHACDWPEGGPRGLDDRVLPGDGVIPLGDEIFGPLRAGGYKGPFTLEILSNQELPDSLWKESPKKLLQRAKAAMAQY